MRPVRSECVLRSHWRRSTVRRPAVMAVHNPPDERDYENKHVHEVYEDIANHFSSTRYKV